MKISFNILAVLFLFSFSFFLGCGPTTYTTDRYEFSKYTPTESKQTKDNITIERVDLKEIPVEFKMVVQGCNAQGQSLVDNENKPYMVEEFIIPKNGLLEKLLITNNTDHVIRLSNTVIVAFDPSGNQYQVLSKDEIKAQLQLGRACPSTNQLINRLSTVKFFDRNTELLPNMTTAGFLYYMPQDWHIPGTWKLTIYDFPVETEASGVVKKTISFDFRTVLKKYKDTYKKEFMGNAQLLSSEEVQ
jgi:hypothetical protein